MSKAFESQVVWITGAGTGLGRAMALEFAARGAWVVVSGRRLDPLQEVVQAIEARGARAVALACDVTREEDVAKAVEAIIARCGRLDVSVANAGFGVGGRVEDLDAEVWRRQFETNVIGLALTARHTLPHLRKTRGRLVLVGSVAGMMGLPSTAPYCASKAAVRVIGQALSAELHGTGVSCTTIQPGFVESDIARVDNQGVYHAEWEDRRPQRLMWKADRAARVMVDAIAARKREFTFTFHGKVAAFLGQHLPGLVNLILRRSAANQRPKHTDP